MVHRPRAATPLARLFALAPLSSLFFSLPLSFPLSSFFFGGSPPTAPKNCPFRQLFLTVGSIHVAFMLTEHECIY